MVILSLRGVKPVEFNDLPGVLLLSIKHVKININVKPSSAQNLKLNINLYFVSLCYNKYIF